MATTSYQTRLESVQAAIAKIESGGQSYSITTQTGSRTVTRGDLSTLYTMEKELRAKASRTTRGGRRVTGITPVNNG